MDAGEQPQPSEPTGLPLAASRISPLWVQVLHLGMLVYQHGDSKGLGGVGTCCGDGAVGRDAQTVGCICKPLKVSAWGDVARRESGNIGSECNRNVCRIV